MCSNGCQTSLINPLYLQEGVPVYVTSFIYGYSGYDSHVKNTEAFWCAEKIQDGNEYIEFIFREKVLVTRIEVTGGSLHDGNLEVVTQIVHGEGINSTEYPSTSTITQEETTLNDSDSIPYIFENATVNFTFKYTGDITYTPGISSFNSTFWTHAVNVTVSVVLYYFTNVLPCNVI